MEDINRRKLSRKPLVRRVRHKLFGHDWEVIKEKQDYWKQYSPDFSPYTPTSYRTLKCNDCGLEREQFFSRIFYRWLPPL